jgi:thiol-disulfide isomerase/thioredoxin
MKRFFSFCCTAFLLLSVSAQNFTVRLSAPGYTGGIAYLAYHNGKNLSAEDSAAMTSKATAVFQGNRKLPAGIYAIVLPGKTKMVDFFIDKEQTIDITIDTTDLLNKTVVKGSSANVPFQQYQKFMAEKGRLWDLERQAYNNSKTKADSALHEANYMRLNKELNDYRDVIINSNPESMMAIILKAMQEPKLLNPRPVTREDSLANYYDYRKHYWDGVTFMDECVIRSPFFIPKFEKYYREIIVQHPDSIIREADYQLLLARSCPEMYKFILNWMTDEYINPKYMGQDAIFVHLFEKYHSKGLTSEKEKGGWLNEKQMETINRRAYMLMANLVGNPAANLEFVDTAGKIAPLYDIRSDYTIVCFWDPNCGHCREEVPRLDSIYKAKWKKQGVKMYGVLSADSKNDVKDAWIKFIREKNLNEWTHVYQTKEMEEKETKEKKASFRQLYDITMTPTVYLLDRDKRILAKKLSWSQLDDLMEVRRKQDKKNPK